MVICDLCHNEIDIKQDNNYRRQINTHYACSAWQSKIVDICESCRIELHKAIEKAEAEFYQEKIRRLE